jgi:hypothetical protein
MVKIRGILSAITSNPNSFKWALLVLATLYLIVYWQGTQNGRYRYERFLVIDTRSGDVRRVTPR